MLYRFSRGISNYLLVVLSLIRSRRARWWESSWKIKFQPVTVNFPDLAIYIYFVVWSSRSLYSLSNLSLLWSLCISTWSSSLTTVWVLTIFLSWSYLYRCLLFINVSLACCNLESHSHFLNLTSSSYVLRIWKLWRGDLQRDQMLTRMVRIP